MSDSKKDKKNLSGKKNPIVKEEVKTELQIPAKKRSKLVFYFIMILIPILFFLLLEVGLRIFGYGEDVSQWMDVSDSQMGLNLEVARKYFTSTKSTPISIRDVFDKVKQPNSFRVFVMGESSAAGYPYMPLGSFSRYIRRRLELTYPELRIEVVNVGLTAITTYTLLDLLPGVLEQKPDLIIIYTGHNEYYGALGVGSIESLGNSRAVVKLLLYMNKFRTVQLLRQIIQSSISLFSSESKKEDEGTLMSKMAKEQYIALGSDLYKAGLEQFAGNMRDIITMTKEKNVPLILGTLTSNLKDQKPFISKRENNMPAAEEIFSKATDEFDKGNYKAADSLFRFAKDLDLLRFRAPEEMNRLIKKLGHEYSLPVVDIDSVFANQSEGNITSEKLMTDHLHPTLDGYFIMGKTFYEEMAKKQYLPSTKSVLTDPAAADSITKANFYFTRLDTLLADYKIRVLKNDWPFVDKKNQLPENELFQLKDFIDTLAYKNVVEDMQWVSAELSAAEGYLKRKEYDSFIMQMKTLIYQFPFVGEYYNKISNVLLQVQRFDEALIYLKKRFEIEPDAFSAKWIGNINLNKNNDDEAIKYLELSLKYNSRDAQVMYNLAGAYLKKKNYKQAYECVEKCLLIYPEYSQARILKSQLAAMLSNNQKPN
ncbi:MAG: tetratricopeptide repeat protein [bacterium]